MFRRRWSGLPEDPTFPTDLKELGYFVNDEDEVRSIADPKFYFKYLLSRNERWNDRQRFAFNGAVVDLIQARLEAQGLTKVFLPFDDDAKTRSEATDPEKQNGTTSALQRPRVPIFASVDIATKSRVVLIFGETAQELGVLAHRVASGPGGVAKGSMVSVVSSILGQRSTPEDPSPPGVVLANTGELWWWPEGGRALSDRMRQGAPMRSAVHLGRFYDPASNAVPRNETPARHVEYVFEEVVPRMVNPEAKIDVIGVGDAAELVEEYLNDDERWEVLGPRLNSLTIVGGFFDKDQIKCGGFRKFLAKRARAYVSSDEPLDHPLSGPEGNPKTSTFTDYGCSVFSSGERYLSEMLFIGAQSAVLPWIEEVAITPNYTNPEIIVTFQDEDVEQDEQESTPGDGKLELITAEDWQKRQEAEAAAAAQA
ncbi:Arb2 domain-containing protein [Pleurostoma richardsiae]|uniref:Arb2 domain-containing protein n=1 Tax=Pleurostoma richardsiae TaxID=41990 RepID=A0AA38SBF7_9PEZI|nr:Arb2 domain-containing protein [Pleurostoma richardsiae]